MYWMKIRICSSNDINYSINKRSINNSAVVSFSDAKEERVKFPEDIDVLHIDFYDVRPFTVSKHHYDKILPEAKQIADFVDKKVKEGKDIICQCDYGISRSAGLAAAILQKYENRGIDIFSDYRYTPNQFVYNKVLQELMEK